MQITPFIKAARGLRISNNDETTNIMYQQFIYILILCGVDINQMSLIEPDESTKRARGYKEILPLQFLFNLYYAEITWHQY